jgi:hypothetical protein
MGGRHHGRQLGQLLDRHGLLGARRLRRRGQDRKVSTNTSTSNWSLNEAVPAGAWVATILLRGGQIAEAFYATGSTAPTGAALDGGGQVMARTVAAGSARWAASTFYASVRAIWRPNFVLTGVTLHTRRTA